MSELRQDLVSGDWIIMAPGRARRLHDMLPAKRRRLPTSKSKCPFENLRASGNWPPRFQYPAKGPWKIAVMRNKYPALRRDERCAMEMRQGPYAYMEGIGHHDVVVTRDHTKDFASLSSAEATMLLRMVQQMHRRFRDDGCSRYVSTFANWGPSAGASLYHPHYQLLALPIIPPDVAHSLEGSMVYFAKHRSCVHCDMLTFEREAGTRIVEAAPRAIAVAPFVSRQPFEVRIYPKRHASRFEDASLRDIREVAGLLQSALRRIKKFLNDPDYNFFIHTAPFHKGHDFEHYHWHVEVFPKISMLAGFELSTGVDINVVTPEEAAAVLKGKGKVAGTDV